MSTNPFDQFDTQTKQSANPFDQFEKPAEKSTGQKIYEYAEPVAETVGAIGGGIAGSALGPVGSVAGAGLGYGGAKAGMRGLGQMLGYEPTSSKSTLQTLPTAAKQAVGDIATGATYEMGGQLGGKLIGSAAQKIGNLTDIFRGDTAALKAGKIARESLGSDLPKARQILSQASDDISASQALAIIDSKTGKAVLNAPVAQALLQRAEARDPTFFTNLFGQQEASRLKTLQQIAGGTDQTAAREAREILKKELNDRLIPVLETELNAANIAGKLKPKFETEASRMGGAATSKVQDVRRFVAAIGRAKDLALQNVIERGLPTSTARYTYIGELAKRADEIANQAANASLQFGNAARFADAATQSLEAHGLRPLTTDSILASLAAKMRDPSMAGNQDVAKVLERVGSDIQKWTRNGGVIDAFALDSIRKNSVNSVIRDLYPQASSKQQKELAASVLSQVRPLLIDAIENAGGTGYRQYLQDYSIGMQQIGQTKLGAEALKIYQSSPQEFVKLIEGNNPELIEKVFGPGSYNILKEMSQNTMAKLQSVATQVQRGQVIGEQATAGKEALSNLLKENVSKFKIPHFFSAKATASNAMLDAIENRVNKKTMQELTKAARTAKSFDDLLSKLPTREKNEFIKAVNDPATFQNISKTITGASILSPTVYGGITDMNKLRK